MRFLRIFSFVLLVVGVLSVVAQDIGEPTIYETPIVERGERGEWDDKYTDPGAVVYHDRHFHMFRNGFKGWPLPVQIGYLTSEDGIIWEEVVEDPVLLSENVPYTRVAALASSVHVEDDGTWVMYFYTWTTYNFRNGEGGIGRATASNPEGPWTPDEALVLEPSGIEGAWDKTQVSTPSVIVTDEGYVMYFTGHSGDNNMAIGIATSDDGITWEKHPEPILVQDEDWEGNDIHQPRVVRADEGWVMLYRSRGDFTSGAMRYGIATSEDGITWTKHAGNPILAPSDFEDGRAFWYTALAIVDGTSYIYVELTPQREVTDILVVTYEGTFLGD